MWFKKIYSSRTLSEIEPLNALLKDNGFNPLETQRSEHLSIAGADQYYYIQVPEEEESSAKDFLKTQGCKNVMA